MTNIAKANFQFIEGNTILCLARREHDINESSSHRIGQNELFNTTNRTSRRTGKSIPLVDYVTDELIDSSDPIEALTNRLL